MRDLICQNCNTYFDARKGAKTCGTRCRVNLHRKNQHTSDTPVPTIPLPRGRPSRPLTPADYDEITDILKDVESFFINPDNPPISVLDIAMEQPDSPPLTVEYINLLTERLQMRDDLALVSSDPAMFIYNKPFK